MLLPIVTLCTTLSLFAQAELTINIVDAVIPTFSPEYLDPDAIHITVNEGIDDVNTVSTNFTIIKQFPDNCMIHLYILGYSMGEYKLPVGIDMKDSLCVMFDEPVILGPFLDFAGLRENGCPPTPGVYGNDKYYPKMDFMPDTFPDGEYRVAIEITQDDETIIEIVVYTEIE